eukprot:9132-Heterococcus_DN1.PRE.1
MAHSKVERSYCYSDSEWLSYFLYIAKRKGIPIAGLVLEQEDGEECEDDDEVTAEAKEALHAEGVHRAEMFDRMSLKGLPMYSVQKLIDADEALKGFNLPHEEQVKRARALRAEQPALDAVLTYDEIHADARHLNRVLRFERTGHGEAKEAFMRDQREVRGSDFGEHDLKLLCTKLLMTKMFPNTEITHTFVKRFEKYRLAVVNQIRLMQDNGM